MSHIGVDGCRDGWIAVTYNDNGFRDAKRHGTISDVWEHHSEATSILIDIPIGLREDSNTARPCDEAARDKLRPHRNRSVFPTPIREVARKAYLDEIDYEEGKRIQEHATEGSISPFAWGIIPKIGEIDHFLLEVKTDAQSIITESHPELCFWALNGGGETDAMQYSKTSQPAAAFWERINVLNTSTIEPHILDHMNDAGTDLDYDIANDDLLDAFVLALTASPKTNPTTTIPDEWTEEDEGDPRGLPMEMTYPSPRDTRRR